MQVCQYWAVAYLTGLRKQLAKGLVVEVECEAVEGQLSLHLVTGLYAPKS